MVAATCPHVTTSLRVVKLDIGDIRKHATEIVICRGYRLPCQIRYVCTAFAVQMRTYIRRLFTVTSNTYILCNYVVA